MKNGTVLFVEKLQQKGFSVAYKHSVNKSLIVDSFELSAEGAVILKSSRFLSFGAGVAAEAAGNGVFRTDDKALVYDEINRKLPELRLFIGTEANHTLITESGEYPLTLLTSPQRSVKMGRKKVTAAETAFGAAVKGVLNGRAYR